MQREATLQKIEQVLFDAGVANSELRANGLIGTSGPVVAAFLELGYQMTCFHATVKSKRDLLKGLYLHQGHKKRGMNSTDFPDFFFLFYDENDNIALLPTKDTYTKNRHSHMNSDYGRVVAVKLDMDFDPVQVTTSANLVKNINSYISKKASERFFIMPDSHLNLKSDFSVNTISAKRSITSLLDLSVEDESKDIYVGEVTSQAADEVVQKMVDGIEAYMEYVCQKYADYLLQTTGYVNLKFSVDKSSYSLSNNTMSCRVIAITNTLPLGGRMGTLNIKVTVDMLRVGHTSGYMSFSIKDFTAGRIATNIGTVSNIDDVQRALKNYLEPRYDTNVFKSGKRARAAKVSALL